jgi:hypothetical protein
MATTCLTNNFRKGLLKADYDFDSGIQDYYMALYDGSSHNQNVSAYTSTNESSGTGYSPGGTDMGDFSQLTDTTNHVSYLDNVTDPSWTTSTITATDCLIYRSGGTSPVANASVYVGDFGGSKSSSAGTFTVVLPADAYNTAIIRLA